MIEGVSWHVRAARADEADELAGLNLRTALAAYGHIFPPEAPAPTHEGMRAQWDHWLGPDQANGRRAFVAVEHGWEHDTIVGAVLVGPDADDPAVGHLSRLNVTPERWAGGIGTDLYETAVRAMAEAGFPSATLWVLERNTRARAWYERLGWRLSGARKPMYAPGGIDDVGYRIDLPAPAR